MALVEFVDQIAGFLSAEARRRTTEAALGNAPQRQIIAAARSIKCEYNSWPEWTRLRIFETKKPARGTSADIDRLEIAVEFNKPVRGPAPHSVRSMRRAFRPGDLVKAQGKGKINEEAVKSLRRYKSLPINRDTPKKVIREVLAIYLIQEDLGDQSLEGLFYDLRPEDPEKSFAYRYIFVRLVDSFVEPEYAGSYLKFRRFLKTEFKRVMSSEPEEGSHNNEEERDGHEDDGPEEVIGDQNDELKEPEQSRPRRKLPASDEIERTVDRAPRKPIYDWEHLTIRLAASKYGISRFVLYRWILQGKLPRLEDENKNLVIDAEHLGSLPALKDEWQSRRDLRRKLIEFYVETRGITKASARLRLDRQVAKHGSRQAVAKFESGFHKWLKAQARIAEEQ